MTERITLQTTPDGPDVVRRPVTFPRGDIQLAGLLFTPRGRSASLPAVVVTGAWTTVKEQMSGTYARELARRGFVALAFDFAGWGESGGTPRYREDPEVKTLDVGAAIDFVADLPEIERDRVGGLGICASAGYMVAAAAESRVLSRLALVAPWLHDPKLAESIYGGPDSARALIEQGRAAARADVPKVIRAASATDESALMYQAPYYTETDRGLVDAYDNRFDVASWEPWLTYDAFAAADRLTTPTLLVCSEAAALPAGAHAFVRRTRAPVTEQWLDDVNQFDFYDRADVVTLASDAAARHLGEGHSG